MKKLILFIKTYFFYMLLMIVIIFSGCSSFPHVNKDQPQSCNDKVDLMNLIVKSNGVFSKDGTTAFLSLLTLSYADCKRDRVTFKKTKCFKESLKVVYGDELKPDKANYKKYTQFVYLINKCQGLK